MDLRSLHRTGAFPVKALWAAWVAAAIDLSAGALIWRWGFGVSHVDPAFSRLSAGTPAVPLWPFCCAALLLWLWQIRRGRTAETAEKGWPLIFACFVPVTFAGLSALLLLAGWSMFRFFAVPPGKGSPPASRRMEKPLFAGVLLLASGSFLWHMILQYHAYEALYLQFQDWGEYLTEYESLAFNSFFSRRIIGCAGHFNGAVNAVMVLLIRLYPAPQMLFCVTAFLLACAPLLAWKLAKCAGFSPPAALGAALIAAMHPVLLNQSLSLGYGYHPSLFQIPLIFGFWIFRAQKKRAGMIAMLALSLCVQETAAILWFGAALMWLVTGKKKKTAAAAALLVLGWFFFLSQIVMPWIFGTQGNPQFFHYHALGENAGELLLSPFLRPRAFWGIVMQEQNALYLMTLLLPTLFWVCSWRIMLMILPMLAGILMQESPAVKNIMLHNSLEIVVMLIAAGIAANGEKEAGVRRANLAATLLLVFAGAFFYGRLPWTGKNSGQEIMALGTRHRELALLQEIVPPWTTVHCSPRWRWRIRETGRRAGNFESFSPRDWVLLEINNPFENAEPLRRRLLASGEFRPVTFFNINGIHILLMQMVPPGTPPPVLPCLKRMPPERFLSEGVSLPLADAPFLLRRIDTPQGALLRFYLTEKTENDYQILLDTADGRSFHLVYGDGFFPAFRAQPGTVYELLIPSIGAGCAVSCRVKPF